MWIGDCRVWSETAKGVWREISKWTECLSAGFIIIIIIIMFLYLIIVMRIIYSITNKLFSFLPRGGLKMSSITHCSRHLNAIEYPGIWFLRGGAD